MWKIIFQNTSHIAQKLTGKYVQEKWFKNITYKIHRKWHFEENMGKNKFRRISLKKRE
jgi:hypothetical protein